ncbi:cytochrome c [Sphaerotilus sp.]|uniref:c-type cytochrome n=1 Tax=Sphaerotilus sp. TaxID=2093942 RepID=UPI0034E2DBEF
MKRFAILAAALAAAFHVQAQGVMPAEPSASAPVSVPMPSAEAGRRAYTSTCARCHGINLVATSSAYFDLRTFPRDEKDRFLNSVTNGKRQMPAWGGIVKPETIESIWLYVGSVNGW